MVISVIVPVYNEKDNLELFHGQLRAVLESLSVAYEIIYVDDGSVDGSDLLLEFIQSKDTCTRLITLNRNCGMTTAFSAGLVYASGDFVFSLDADLQCPPKNIPRFFLALQEYDVVIGVRLNRKAVDGLIKHWSSRISNACRNLILGEKFRDAGCFLRGYRRRCLQDLVLYKGFQVLMISLLNMSKYRIQEIEFEAQPRRHGKSKFGVGNRLGRELLALLVVRWMKSNRIDFTGRLLVPQSDAEKSNV